MMTTAIQTGEGPVFHEGERAVQERLGVRERVEPMGRRMLRDHMPDQHREFFAALPFVVVGAVDAEGWPAATLLAGTPGFLGTADSRTLRVGVLPDPDDPLAGALRPGAPLGFLGMMLENRRRNRLNGRVTVLDGEGFSVGVDQSFGNCPQYIQTRGCRFVRPPGTPGGAAERLPALDAEARAMIESADTLFVATHAGGGDAVHGADVSHRGGRPGFVRVDGDGTLTIPDYAGNLMFNTLGNLLSNPRAGLLFVDFASGDLLHVAGTAEIVWEGPEAESFRGAERLWKVRAERVLRRRDAVPLRWEFREASPNSLITGTWAEARATAEAERERDRFRPFRVTRLVDEADGIRSFHLEPADGLGLPRSKAGQFLPIRVPLEDGGTVLRTYTLSSAPGDPAFRITVKRGGSGSAALHDRIAVGDVIEATAPRGDFVFDADAPRPAVLLSAGIGITPMIAMLRHAAVEKLRNRRARSVWFAHVARTTAERPFVRELTALAAALGGAATVHLAVTGDAAADDPHVQSRGRITADLLRRLLPFGSYDFYLCGPGGFMQDLYDGLRALDVPDERIHAEAFGPSALKRSRAAAAAAAPEEAIGVAFAASGKEAVWTPGAGTLLDVAEAAGIDAPHGCRSGACGACAVPLAAGSVDYVNPPLAEVTAGHVLTCSAVPRGPVTLGL